MKLAVIKWVDAISQDSGWKSIAEMKTKVPCECKTVGWIVNKNDEFLIVVSSITDDGDCDGDTVIPMGMVKSIYYLDAPYERPIS